VDESELDEVLELPLWRQDSGPHPSEPAGGRVRAARGSPRRPHRGVAHARRSWPTRLPRDRGLRLASCPLSASP
jgi:hypothetical protein